MQQQLEFVTTQFSKDELHAQAARRIQKLAKGFEHLADE
jgi:hypothetical protein